MTDNPKATTLTLSNKAYDVLKFIAQVVLPALGTLYFGLSAVWHHLPFVTEIVGTITVVDVFLGVLLGINTKTYQQNKADEDDDEPKDGTFHVNTTDPNKDSYTLEINAPLEDVAQMKKLTLKVSNPNSGE